MTSRFNPQEYQVMFEDSINRIIGMNMSIAMNDCESDRYYDARVISLVVTKTNFNSSPEILSRCEQVKNESNIKPSELKGIILKLPTDKFICSED